MPPLQSYETQSTQIILIHGGPAAPGNISILAGQLTKFERVIQLSQDEDTIDKTLIDFRTQLKKKSVQSPIIIGHSFGAWLAAFYATKFPDSVAKLILLGMGPIRNEYVKSIHQTRLNRLNSKNGREYLSCLENIYNYDVQRAKLAMRRLKTLTEITDQYKPIRRQDFSPPVNLHIFKSLSTEMHEHRKRGLLAETFKKIQCPISIIHGKYDPHPVAGISKPLDEMRIDYKLKVLPKGGHELWMEMNCNTEFLKILETELSH